MSNEKIAEESLAQTRSPQDAYEYAIRREKRIEQQSQSKNRYTTLKHVAETINRSIKTIREAGVVSSVDHIHVETKTHEDNNNNEIQIRDNATNVGTNMDPIIYNQVQQRTKFAQNVPSEVTSQKFVGPKTSTT